MKEETGRRIYQIFLRLKWKTFLVLLSIVSASNILFHLVLYNPAYHCLVSGSVYIGPVLQGPEYVDKSFTLIHKSLKEPMVAELHGAS